ncbi:MAG TPA: adenylate/guanylate cyclase domain-containing protein [Gallionellaceae bacterium]
MTLFVLGSVANLYSAPLARKLERITYDTKLRLFMPGTRDDRIVILDIDEKSLKEEGRWPWSRNRLGLLMDKLFDHYGVATVGFDVVFPEKDESSGLDILENLGRNQLKGVAQFRSVLEKLRPQLEYDRVLASKIKGRPVVLGYYFTFGSTTGALPEPALPGGAFAGHAVAFMPFDGYGGNLPELQKNAASAGHFNPVVDEDGMVRRLPMLVEYQGAYYESLSLAVVRTLLGGAKLAPVFSGKSGAGYSDVDGLELQTARGSLRIPANVDDDGFGGKALSTLVPYRGKSHSFAYVSVTDVLHDRVAPEALHDKIVLIGTSAPGLQDLRSTPVDATYPGVEAHANMIAGIMDQDIKQKPSFMLGAEFVLVLLLGVALSLLLPRMTPGRIALAAGGLLLAVTAFDFWLWRSAGLDLPLAHSLMLVSGLFVLNMSYGYFFESRTKRQITSLFGQYVPAALVEELSKRPEEVSMESESREMTILFSDVRGFTSISEQLDPRELSHLMNEFLTAFTRVIHRHRGTIDKYMGDCIMAFWGAPLHSDSHARDAVYAGMEMFEALHQLQQEFKARGWPEIRMGVGINTGKVVVGNMGSEVRVAYTVMGDAVNLASRLESISKEYRIDFVVGEATRAAVPGVVYRELDLVRVKGKDKPVAIYEPVGLEGKVGPEVLEELKLYHQALRLYRNQEWDKAEQQFISLQRMYPKNRLYQVFVERIAHFRANPPEAGWGGVYDWHIK